MNAFILLEIIFISNISNVLFIDIQVLIVYLHASVVVELQLIIIISFNSSMHV